jgi:hypothetical protein
MAVSLKGFTPPTIDYGKLLVCSYSYVLPSRVRAVYVRTPYYVINSQVDYGVISRDIAVELLDSVVYVADLRHSHDLDTHDTTQFSVTANTTATVLTVDYGSTLNAMEVVVLLGLWAGAAGYTHTINIDISTDGSTWTNVFSKSITLGTSEVYLTAKLANLSFRYLRVSGSAVTTTLYIRVRKIIVTV